MIHTFLWKKDAAAEQWNPTSYDRREQLTRGLRITKEAPLMRHFTVELERL